MAASPAGPSGRPGGTWAIIAGGGTGGHVVPAIAIATALVGRGHDPASIRFVGSRRGIETRLVPAAGFELTTLPGRGIARRLTAANVGAVAGLVAAFVRAVVLVRRLRPAVTVSVGGYASAPAVLASVLWRVPVVVAEQNAVPGVANRLAGRFARAAAVSFEGTPLPRAVVTGNPVRPEMVSADTSAAGRAAARAALGLAADRSVVAVAGGSLGARRINDAVRELAAMWAERADVCIYHVIGRRDFAAAMTAPPVLPAGGLDYRPVEFEDRMPLLFAAADVGVQRAGASTVAELAVVGLPCVLVPLPGAPGDHQTVNARRLAEAGAAVLVPDNEMDGGRLARELDRLLADTEARLRMAAAARALGRPGAADEVAALVDEVAGERGGD
ncbi:MAG TPA: undecaprenyldiphospho-muramoylpentapeptide beta-N-acetylglucosaminyltransferase [Acidimicrobiales bacterium]|nr:undecaprenyldiphospho-muramoylpentapeptide beta-N-acetylglucosaminyltransferase [Acidimicrobiales bacterium]